MSALTLCTLTGADDSTEPSDLLRLSADYSFVEWGVLYHQAHQRKGRYPSFKWINALWRQIPSHPSAHFALHICGRDAIAEFLRGEGHVSRTALHFGRVQLNLVAASVNPALLTVAIQRHPDKVIITQHNSVNQGLWQLLSELPNHAILFDESGGRGLSPTSWPTPLRGKLCGYAGGLGPDNLAAELPRIQRAAEKRSFWIAMEGQLRNATDQFDLARAQRCLSICQKFRSA